MCNEETKCACDECSCEGCDCGENCGCGQDSACEACECPNEAHAKAAEYLDMAQRIQAEFENYKKRTKNARDDAFALGRSETVAKLLGVLDNLERALSAAAETRDESLKQGLEMVVKQFVEALAGMDITPYGDLTDTFDPALHYAVGQELRPETQPGTITQLLQKGYIMKDYVIRPAMVLVQGEPS
ncbi:MAG: nucleotide exchange factor GrpE [Clostridia bacterium]|nr:nucleotide exchange factor GrpE [Clostridia bacterium]